MTRGPRHDPVAVFAFALRERDWVLADLIAHSAARSPATRRLLARVVLDQSRARASPATLRELSGWAELSRRLGIANGGGDDESAAAGRPAAGEEDEQIRDGEQDQQICAGEQDQQICAGEQDQQIRAGEQSGHRPGGETRRAGSEKRRK
ncbi:MAG: hypothetical protein U0R52_11635 [Solirubrobacterales bacterium]